MSSRNGYVMSGLRYLLCHWKWLCGKVVERLILARFGSAHVLNGLIAADSNPRIRRVSCNQARNVAQDFSLERAPMCPLKGADPKRQRGQIKIDLKRPWPSFSHDSHTIPSQLGQDKGLGLDGFPTSYRYPFGKHGDNFTLDTNHHRISSNLK